MSGLVSLQPKTVDTFLLYVQNVLCVCIYCVSDIYVSVFNAVLIYPDTNCFIKCVFAGQNNCESVKIFMHERTITKLISSEELSQNIHLVDFKELVYAVLFSARAHISLTDDVSRT